MLNFMDTLVYSDWGTPLLILALVLLVSLALLAGVIQWLEVWSDLIREEEEGETRLPAWLGRATPTEKRNRGWGTHHV